MTAGPRRTVAELTGFVVAPGHDLAGHKAVGDEREAVFFAGRDGRDPRQNRRGVFLYRDRGFHARARPGVHVAQLARFVAAPRHHRRSQFLALRDLGIVQFAVIQFDDPVRDVEIFVVVRNHQHRFPARFQLRQ